VVTYGETVILDTDGDRLRLSAFWIPAALEDVIASSTGKGAITYYMLRLQNKNVTVGVVYAIEIDDQKVFYPSEAFAAVKMLVKASSKRLWLQREGGPWIGGGALIAPPFLVLMTLAGLLNEHGAKWLALLLGGAFAVWWFRWNLEPALWPRKLAGLDEMDRIMAEGGFTPLPSPKIAAKY
jgi:hypothetical protein